MSTTTAFEVSKQILLDTPLIQFSSSPEDWWTIRDAVRGVQIFGGIGSGKSSGSGQTIAMRYLEHGFGGLILCAKPGEAAEWLSYAKKAGRKDSDIILFSEGSKWQFNPLEYESTRTTKGGGLTFNLTELFMTAFKMGARISGSDSEEKEKFWENALKRCINRLIDLIKLSKETLSVSNMVEILNTSPTDLDTKNRLSTMEDKDIIEWGKKDFFIKCIFNAAENDQSPQQKRDFDLVFNYFTRDFAQLDERTRSSIKETFLGYAEPFLSGLLNDHFSNETNLTPEDTFEGKIIILDFAVKDYLVSGIYAQCLFKYLWQQAVERRIVKDDTKPVFLWVDESQYFVNEYDTIFQTTARSSRACTVFLTQNISNYYAYLGGKQSESKVDSLLGNLSTMIFHANSDTKTNSYATNLIGNALQNLGSVSQTENEYLNYSTSKSKSMTSQFAIQVQPRLFTTLKSGGEQNEYLVEGIMFISGREWSDGRNFNEVSFEQRFS